MLNVLVVLNGKVSLLNDELFNLAHFAPNELISKETAEIIRKSFNEIAAQNGPETSIIVVCYIMLAISVLIFITSPYDFKMLGFIGAIVFGIASAAFDRVGRHSLHRALQNHAIEVNQVLFSKGVQVEYSKDLTGMTIKSERYTGKVVGVRKHYD